MTQTNARTATHCPECFSPVEMDSRSRLGHREGMGYCPSCRKNWDARKLVEAVQCAACNRWVSAEGVTGDEMTCPNCKTHLQVSGENTIVKEDEANLPYRCPACHSPVSYKEKGVFTKEKIAYCDNKACANYGRTLQPHQLVREVKCCSCYQWINVNEFRKGRADCPHCDKALVLEGSSTKLYVEDVPVNVEQVLGDDWVIYRSPERKFGYQTAVPMMPGFNAVLVEGTTAKIITPDDPKPFVKRDQTQPIFADLYYVRSQFNKTFRYGTPEPLEVQDAYGNLVQIRAASEVEHGVDDPLKLLSWSGHREIKSEDFESEGRILRSTTVNCFSRAIHSAAQQILQAGESLTAMKLADKARGIMSEMLSAETGLSCRSLRIVNLTQENMADLLAARVERSIHWSTADIQVHEQNEPALWASIRISGSATIRVTDRGKLMTTPQGVEWSRKDTADDAAEAYLRQRIGEQVYGVFQEIIQGVIDDTGVSIDYLGHFFSHMQRVAGDYLNDPESLLKSFGLRADNVTIQLKPEDIRPNAALIRRGQVEKQIATTEMDEKLRKYTDGVELTRRKDDSQKHIAFKRIETDERISDIGMDDEVAQAADDIAKKKHERQLDEIKRGGEIDKARDAVEDEQRAHRQQIELETLDHAYQKWLKVRRGETAQHDALHADERGDTEHALELKRMREEEQRQQALEMERLRAAVADVRRGIEASDMDQKQKQEAYEYLQLLSHKRDDQDLAERKARFEADMDQAGIKGAMDAMQASLDMVSKAADDQARREESARYADFARDLQLKQVMLTHEAEVLKLKMAADRQQQEAAERTAQADARLKEMELQLKHLESMESIGVNRADVQASVDKIRAICEAMAQESVARAEQVKAGAAAAESERESTQTRAEALLKELMTIQKQREEMQMQFRREFDAGRAEVDKILAEHVSDVPVSDALADLKRQMDEMVKNLNTARPPVRQDINIVTGNPAMRRANDVCPNCGAKITNRYATYCISCGTQLK